MELAEQIDGVAVRCDVTSEQDVRALADAAGPELAVLVANAGGALGKDPVAAADLGEWRTMYETNVLGVAACIQAMLPALLAAEGVIVTIGSVAGLESYAGGGGYCGAKHAVAAMMRSLRMELFEQPVRVCEIDPGMVESDEFSLVRFHGDEQAAAKVYEGVVDPLQQEDIADCVAFVVSRPPHVNIDRLVVRPRAQASSYLVHRRG